MRWSNPASSGSCASKFVSQTSNNLLPCGLGHCQNAIRHWPPINPGQGLVSLRSPVAVEITRSAVFSPLQGNANRNEQRKILSTRQTCDNHSTTAITDCSGPKLYSGCPSPGHFATARAFPAGTMRPHVIGAITATNTTILIRTESINQVPQFAVRRCVMSVRRAWHRWRACASASHRHGLGLRAAGFHSPSASSRRPVTNGQLGTDRIGNQRVPDTGATTAAPNVV